MGIAQKHGAAGRGGHSVFGGWPYDIGAIGIGQDQACVLRKLAGRHALGDREEKPVAVGAIIAPFGVGTEIREGGFDFDDKDLAVALKRDDVGAPPEDQRQ
jgi:hypothetical protein